MSRFEQDNKLISWIQFHSEKIGWDKKTRNEKIQEIEDRQHQEEQKNIDGIDTGYYN